MPAFLTWYRSFSPVSWALALLGVAGSSCGRPEGVLRIAVTTSMEGLGVVEELAEAFSDETGIPVQIVAMPSGQALESLVRGDVDAAFAHAPELERTYRRAYRYLKPRARLQSEFVIAGPASDPAGVREAASPADAFARIARARVPFVSREDRSGTAEFERNIWQEAGVRPEPSLLLPSGLGASESLLLAAEKRAYTVSPLPSWMQWVSSFEYETYTNLFGDPERMPNPYTLYTACPEGEQEGSAACQGVEAFADYLASTAGRRLVQSFTVGGVAVFREVEIP